MTAAVFGLVVVLIVALLALVGTDILTGGRIRPVAALRKWQGLIGTVLGFSAAAGIFTLSSSIEAETAARREQQALALTGAALLIEARGLDDGLGRAQALEGVLLATDQGQDLLGGCGGAVATVAQSLASPTPIYDAAVPRFVEAGDQALPRFATFYGAYGEIAREVGAYVAAKCPVTDAETAADFRRRLAAARLAFAALSGEEPTAQVIITPPTDAARP